MFIDASAIVAILAREADADELVARLEAAPRRLTSALAIYEATLAVSRLRALKIAEARELVLRFLATTTVELVEIGEREAALALGAFDRFGKGRHPAALNLGDCFAYACAQAQFEPLLFKGADFSQTDIPAA